MFHYYLNFLKNPNFLMSPKNLSFHLFLMNQNYLKYLRNHLTHSYRNFLMSH
jgi:hypothetical protein